MIIWNIFELDKDNAKQKHTSRFEFLDGYRGSLAIVVAISHIINSHTCELFNSTLGFSLTYGVAGFFMLSAFLLTYRLVEDLNRAKSGRLVLLQIVKYFIRRFFRIYLVYFLFVVALKCGPRWISYHQALSYNSSFIQMVTLGNAGLNHLWTIPAEIRYYFFIPLFCLVVHMLKRYKYKCLFLLFCFSWTIYDQMFNFFGLVVEEIQFHHPQIHYLRPHFAVFFLGTLVALAYHLVTQSESIMSMVKTEYGRIGLDWTSLLIALAGLKHNWWLLYDKSDFAYRSRATLYWSSALFLTLLSQPNTLSNYFDSNRILKSVGKYSFSFYLFHMGIGAWLRQFPFQDQLSLVFCGLSLSFLFSFFTFYLVENPLIRLANSLCAKLDSHPFFNPTFTEV